ncbi:unnamed protein product [Ceratitis capitata]|uniref:(Mediterranean fruit fly) hypothetical protein n=1 Tax=Ceratitis capitata TaxID=7213 RepID=A0A811UEK7_CERCA|nr:unnamed protein product [Ceratitis capitata]
MAKSADALISLNGLQICETVLLSESTPPKLDYGLTSYMFVWHTRKSLKSEPIIRGHSTEVKYTIKCDQRPTSTCGSLKVRLRRLTVAEINAAQNEVQDTESETSTVEFIINTGETASDSDSDEETFGMAIENTTRYEEDHNVEKETALTLLAEEDFGLEQWLKEITDTEVQTAEPEVVDEIEKWLRQTGEPTITPPGWRNFTNNDPLTTELIAKIQGRVDQQPGKR